MKIKSDRIEIVDIDSIIENPDNNNRHSIEQIEMLRKGIKHNGFRVPLIISKRSGFLISGHGRLEAARLEGYEKLPVIYQEFENEAEEYQFLTFDNEIARWSQLDRQAVYDKIEMLDIDIELLGIQNFEKIEESSQEEKHVDLTFEYKLEINCGNEEQQQYLQGELQDRGFKVRVLI